MNDAGAELRWEREFRTSSAAQTQELARTLGASLRAGDLLLLTGELGAGKTTFTQGLGEGLGVRPGIISPTFVLVRIHPSLGSGPDLVHVDAYRLGSPAEIDDIDLENTMDTAVTVVEWGHGLVEHLSESRLEITLLRATGGGAGATGELVTDFSAEDDDEERTIRIAGYGPRWAAVPVTVP
ncbi:tRNA (adenosine(37)-N6)-threonylcarbamoyltransferase complex ATPase subunit type 1 TsaE [Arthrobacter caoxuetaonis]|uniref:tRNA threonylcarbamoyladenosine biosynthesis protein TsaE n=1 Tax=Arthrobacter caoxuetaonis TaxID=2886935 RepID=A0A9X1MB58_9MICC|nr:tRNA (adenosine(37)-N6)-threonylcarbamoyltransferase complex ATPase subunit type 1 TsaE [Arthrobacter caoxuetaonis]MCC3296603.1 tRNA (adenosine(37)-N6)-threonylcarbamoyltransferase complex ATPase subunit type 1 TsaE [Arthrobacter caoxuetaonis]USQ56569.1 tRNA (adenosine(37)-N6)-threonylcarbamoyltransferase complex ATPase subunit type 1 TsaE [Arthrobacter caoxuetaonis]